MLSSLNPFDSGETLRAKWGERLKPASWRIVEVDEGINAVASAIRNSAKYSQAMHEKSNQDASREIDKIVNTEVVMKNLTAEEVGLQTNKAAVGSPESHSAVSNVLNLDAAREAVTKSLGGGQ